MNRKKLTDSEIMEMEAFVKGLENARNNGRILSPEEETIVKEIKFYMNNDWKGIRIEKTEMEEAKRSLEQLKRGAY